jgi:hypothetical protein
VKLSRRNLEVDYFVDMIQHKGFLIQQEDEFSPVTVDELINSPRYLDSEYRCDCGAFIGQDLVGQQCPRCKEEIALRSLDFEYTGWMDLGKHHVIAPVYYSMLKRVLGASMLRFIIGDYKSDRTVQYNENDSNFEENKKKKKSGRVSLDDITYIRKKIPKSKLQYEGLGLDEFYNRFEEVLTACGAKSNPELEILLREKSAVFTSKIPVYSTAFRPVTKTSETMFYPKINKSFSMICAIYLKLKYMTLDIELIPALNYIQNYLNEASEYLIKSEISKKEGFVRSEIVGGTFNFSGRGVITFDNTLPMDEVDVPFPMLLTAFTYRITHILAVNYNMTLEQAYLYVQTYPRCDLVLSILDKLLEEGQWIFILREPTNNLASIELCKIRRYKLDTDTISLPPEVLAGFNADFDGDALNTAFLPAELVPEFRKFRYSCMTNYVTEKFDINLKEWNDVCLGRMSD